MAKASLIISAYKNVKDLEVILNELVYQSEQDFEIIISEDGDSEEMENFISNYISPYKISHLTHADCGWRKNKALNKAVKAAKSRYLIFVDGDCVLHPRFIENHLRFAAPDSILGGKRIKLGEAFSKKLRQGHLRHFTKNFLLNTAALFRDKVKFFEEGFYINPDGLLSIIANRRKIRHLKGCNFSCYKDAIIHINGFDEDYVKPAIGEDIDLSWRFKGLGYKLVSVRNYAVQYHLYHRENWTSQEENLKLMLDKQANKLFRCKNGLEKEQPILTQSSKITKPVSV